MKHSFCLILFVLGTSLLKAENGAFSDGKLLSVVLVFASILIGFFIYLFSLDRKLTKIENQIKDE